MSKNPSLLLISNMIGQMGKGQSVSETLANLLLDKGWQVFITSGKLPRLQRLADMLNTTWKYRNHYQVAFIEVYSGLAFVWAELVTMLLRRLGKPYILGLFGGNLPNFAKNNNKRVKHMLSRANVVIAPSGYTQELMRPYRSDIRIFPYGVDLKEFNYHQRTHPKPKLLTMRAFHAIYNLSLAPQVLSLLLDDFPDAELVMIGGDKGDGSWELTENTIEYLGLDGKIKMPGFLPRGDVPYLMNEADIMLNTPNIDNTPVSQIEGMSCGLCIVSTNVGGLPYLLEHDKDALLVPPNDPQEMAGAVRRLLTEPGLARNLSQNAHRKAKQYDWSVILPRWEQLLEEQINI